MSHTNLFRLLARVSAGLLVLHLFFLWIAERRGAFLGFEPAHFWQTGVLFFLLAIYLLAESFLTARAPARAAQEVEEIVEVHTGETAAVSPETLAAGSPQPARKSPYVLAAAILGGSLLVAGLILSDNSSSRGSLAGAGQPAAAPQIQAPTAPQLQQALPPTKVAVAFGDTPILNKGAKVQFIEFGDFQCPFCGRFFSQTFPQIKKEYIDTGKIAYQHRDYPLPFHQNAQKAHEAGRCALEQSETAYWDLHDAFYENQNALDVASLKQTATKLGLNASKFNSCLDSGKYADAVKKDYDEGSVYGVSGTPSFFVNGEKIVGAQPFSVFQQAIEKYLQ